MSRRVHKAMTETLLQISGGPVQDAVLLHTSEALIARSDVEGALLHGQLVELGELRRDGSRGRLREGERKEGRRERVERGRERGEIAC